MDFKHHKLLILGFFLLFGKGLFAQTQTYSSTDSSLKLTVIRKPIEKKPKPITRETSFGFRLNSDGWSAVFESGKSRAQDLKRIEQFYDLRFFQIEFSERRHPKELRMYGWDARTNSETNSRYAFGKVNNFYALKFNMGNRKMIAGKPYAKSVSVHWVYAGGLALGLLKPYYVNAFNLMGQEESVKYTPETAPFFLNNFYVLGSGGFAKGLNEIQIKPGLHLKTALRFDFGTEKTVVSALEVGGTAEIYSSKIELVAHQNANQAFFNVYAGIHFGKRRR